MRLIKTVFLVLIALAIVILGVGNMEPVELHLLPEKVVGPAFMVRDVPLFAVILVSVMVGLIAGRLLEWLREGRVRKISSDRGREVVRLREEVAKLKAQVADPDDDLPKLPAR
ncbi:MAG: LapA family protein [Pseudomonadota bacterium]